MTLSVVNLSCSQYEEHHWYWSWSRSLHPQQVCSKYKVLAHKRVPMSWTTRACPTPSAEATKILSSPHTHPREDGFIPFGDWFPGASQVSGGTVCDCSIAPLCSLPFRREALRHTPSADHVQCSRRSGEWESHTVVFVSLSLSSIIQLSLIHISEPTRLRRMGSWGGWW